MKMSGSGKRRTKDTQARKLTRLRKEGTCLRGNSKKDMQKGHEEDGKNGHK